MTNYAKNISTVFLWGNGLFRGKLQADAKNSNFEILRVLSVWNLWVYIEAKITLNENLTLHKYCTKCYHKHDWNFKSMIVL